MKETKMARAWKIAAKDLSVEFVSPFICRDENGIELTCSGWLPHFGGPKGAIILGREDNPPPEIENEFEFVHGLGYWASGLSPFYYEHYNRRSFINELRDIGWFGPEELRPIWFLENTVCNDEITCEACQHKLHSVDPAICSKEKPCEACRFYNKVPYWTNSAWKRKHRKRRKELK